MIGAFVKLFVKLFVVLPVKLFVVLPAKLLKLVLLPLKLLRPRVRLRLA